MKILSGIMALKVLVLASILIFSVSCKEKVVYECILSNICDSVLFCSFEQNGDTYYFEQKMYPESIYEPIIDTANLLQTGMNLGHRIEFFENENMCPVIDFSKIYSLSELDYCSRFNESFYDSTMYLAKYFPDNHIFNLINDTMFSETFYKISSYFENYISEKNLFRDSKYGSISGGFNFELLMDGYYWNLKNYNPEYNIPENSHSSYLYINNIYPYYEDYYIVTGNFQIEVYSTSQSVPRLIRNGKFKLLIKINEEVLTNETCDY